MTFTRKVQAPPSPSDLPKANLTAPDPPPGAGAIHCSHPRVPVAVSFAPRRCAGRPLPALAASVGCGLARTNSAVRMVREITHPTARYLVKVGDLPARRLSLRRDHVRQPTDPTARFDPLAVSGHEKGCAERAHPLGVGLKPDLRVTPASGRCPCRRSRGPSPRRRTCRTWSSRWRRVSPRPHARPRRRR